MEAYILERSQTLLIEFCVLNENLNTNAFLLITSAWLIYKTNAQT